jgi:hypothetical protein
VLAFRLQLLLRCHQWHVALVHLTMWLHMLIHLLRRLLLLVVALGVPDNGILAAGNRS